LITALEAPHLAKTTRARADRENIRFASGDATCAAW
jgi:hypothetical protein